MIAEKVWQCERKQFDSNEFVLGSSESCVFLLQHFVELLLIFLKLLILCLVLRMWRKAEEKKHIERDIVWYETMLDKKERCQFCFTAN